MANGSGAKAISKPKGDGLFARISKFVRESYIETFKKSSWPNKQELWQFTIIVIFAVLVVSTWIGGIDLILTELTARLGK